MCSHYTEHVKLKFFIVFISTTGTTRISVGASMTWTDADAYCESHSSSLAKIPDERTNLEITVKLTLPIPVLEAWIGLKKKLFWHWSDTSENYTLSNWQQGQPDNLNGDQNCAAVVVQSGTWTDEQCNTQYPFFCYDGMKH